MRALRRLLSGYNELLRRHRLPTSTVSGAILAYAGDGITQMATCVRTGDDYDARRGVAFTLFGGFFTGPINYTWLGWLDKRVTKAAPAGGLRAVALKVCAQSFVLQVCPASCPRPAPPRHATPLTRTAHDLRAHLLPVQRSRTRLEHRDPD